MPTRLRDIVVILPGILGSVLQKDGKDIWSPREVIWSAVTGSDSIDALKLNGDDPQADNLGDGVKAIGLVEVPKIVAGLAKVDDYAGISQTILETFDSVTPGKNFFKFPYDWRRDNRAGARQLKKLADEKLQAWKESSGAEDAKLILLAHSMGGLVARYYLEVLGGWKNCRALFTFGTPHRGSVEAVNFLANGQKKLRLDVTDVLRSLTSVYQLLPMYPMLKVGNGYERIAEATVELPNIVNSKAKDALKFHHEIRDAVKARQIDGTYGSEDSYKLIPIVGTMQKTNQSAFLNQNGQLEISQEFPDAKSEGKVSLSFNTGDGTVPYVSAIPIELSEEYRQTYIAERHGSIQNNSQVLEQVCNLIAAMQEPTGLSNYQNPGVIERSQQPAAICLDIEDVYLAGEGEIYAQVVNGSEDFGKLRARIQPVSNEGATKRADFQEKDGQWCLSLESLEEGIYRIEVRVEKIASKMAPTPVHDVFAVVKN
jgi:Lecithin:cholesterol acyltransferase